MAKLKVALHRFQTYAGHPGRDGANLAYEELFRLLGQNRDMDCEPHDVLGLFADDQAASRALSSCDVVVSTVGPHSYIYFYLRERLKLNFRIVRDVRTALWNGYLLQEALVGPYLRPGDAVVYSSAYSRDLFRYLFPAVQHESQHVCYPLVRWFPPLSARGRSGPGSTRTIGFVGRLTNDKNFDQALDLIARLEQLKPGRFRLMAVGQGKPPHGSPYVAEKLGRSMRAYTWSPPVPPDEIWPCFNDFDLMFFPSTSTLETFGRAVVEAAYSGVPILASSHGASPELLEPGALLQARYRTDRKFITHFAAPLGTVDIEDAVNRILDSSVPLSRAHEIYSDDHLRFADIVANSGGGQPAEGRRSGCSRLHKRLTMHDLPALDREQCDRSIRRLRQQFITLHQRGPSYAWTVLALFGRSRYKRKTLAFMGRSLFKREDFTNIGGIDLEFTHSLGFYPWFKIRDMTEAEVTG